MKWVVALIAALFFIGVGASHFFTPQHARQWVSREEARGRSFLTAPVKTEMELFFWRLAGLVSMMAGAFLLWVAFHLM